MFETELQMQKEFIKLLSLNKKQNQNILEEVEYSISLSVKDNYDVNEVIFYVDDNLIMN